jgi:hypothetical protein
VRFGAPGGAERAGALDHLLELDQRPDPGDGVAFGCFRVAADHEPLVVVDQVVTL